MSNPHLTGLVQRSTHLDWTCLHIGKRKAAVAQRSRRSEEDSDGEPPTLAEELVASRKLLKGELHYAIPASSALIHVVDLPTTDEEEIAGMVELQVDDLTPFPVDRTYVSWEILARTETDSRVLIALAGHGVVDPLNEAFQSAKLLVHRVDVDVLCWWRLLARNQSIPESGFHLLLLVDQSRIQLLAFDRGLPVAIHYLGSTEEFESADELQEELGFVLTELEAGRGLVDPQSLTVWHWGAVPAFVDGLKSAEHVRTENFSTLPPLSEGVGLRAVELDGSGVDLSPPEWKEAEAARRMRNKMLAAAGGIAAVWMVAMLGFMVYVNLKHNEVRELRSRVNGQASRVEEVRSLEEQVRSLSQFTDRTYSALECLREVAVHLPVRGIEVKSVTYRKDRGLTIKGNASNQQRDFMPFHGRLERSELFTLDPFQLTRDDFTVKMKWAWLVSEEEEES